MFAPTTSRAAGLVASRAARLSRPLPSSLAVTRRVTTPALRCLVCRQCLPGKRTVSTWPQRQPEQAPLPTYIPRDAFKTFWRTERRRRIRNGLFTVLMVYACLLVYMEIVVDPLNNLLDDLDEYFGAEGAAGEEEGDEDDEYGLFLPFPFWKELVEEPPYRSTDPEWKTFLAISKDGQKQKEIKQLLARHLNKRLARNHQVINMVGGPPAKVQKMWIELVYPNSPPAQYYVPGLLFFENGIAWAERPTPTPGALDAIFEPKAAASAVGGFFTTLAVLRAETIARMFGSTVAKGNPNLSQHQPYKIVPAQSPSSPTGSPASVGVVLTASTQSKLTPYELAMNSIRLRNTGAPQPGALQLAVAIAFEEYAKNRKVTPQPHSRGCIYLDGMVIVGGKKATMQCTVRAAYNPASKDFEMLNLVVMNSRDHVQKPADPKGPI